MPDPSHMLSHRFSGLQQQLLAAAEAFAGEGAAALAELLSALVADVERATTEPLEIFPVCHHSPAAAVHMVQRLRAGPPPKVIFIELCEDLLPVLEKLRDCKLPVALQAFASQSQAFPKSWQPLSVIAPLTEFSAEYQAISYCVENPQTALVFVDRSVDHVFQWMPQKEDELEKHVPSDESAPDDLPAEVEEDEAEAPAAPPTPGSAVGIQIGVIEPTFPLFHEFLLKNARVKYFAEWWDRYVEQPLLVSDYATYRQVMNLVGSLLRRLGRKDEDTESDRQRERFMWTRMKDYLAKHRIAPADALHICGAVHAVSDVAEYGADNSRRWQELPPRSDTVWLYGLLPSSYRAIDWQFNLPPGSVTLSEAHWDKSKRAMKFKPFAISKSAGKTKGKDKVGKAKAEEATVAPPSPPPGERAGVRGQDSSDLLGYLTRSHVLAAEDHEQLLAWCVGIVGLARRNGYLASTADSIAVYHNAVLLAQLRNRTTPTPYDFRDAAITCLEKDRTPKKRDIARLCDVLLGGDRIGQVGRDSLPPLAQNVYDRLAPLGLDLQATTVQRALMDIRKNPDLLPVSELLWKLFYLLGSTTVKPIMGEKVLGQTPIQESWEVYIGRNQTPIITLGYEGVSVEQVLDQRIRAKAFGPESDTVSALAAVHECLLFLPSPRLAEEIGLHAVELLARETGAQTAPEIFDRVRRLIHYFRSTPGGLPAWIKTFVTTGYSHYTTLLPTAFGDKGTTPEQVAGMLAFVFTLESLALSLGCQRSQLAIAVGQAESVAEDPQKMGLLWTAQWLLGQRTVETIRQFFDELLENPLTVSAMPAYLNGHLLALKFTPLAGPLVVELTSKAFAQLPEETMKAWMPGLIMMLRAQGEEVLPSLLKEAGRIFPADLAGFANWTPPWQTASAPVPAPMLAPGPASAPAQLAERNGDQLAVYELLAAHPAAVNDLAVLLGAVPAWQPLPLVQSADVVAPASAIPPTSGNPPNEAGQLLARHPAACQALAKLIN